MSIRSSARAPTAHRIFAHERGARTPRGAIACEIGNHIRIDPSKLGRFCSEQLSERADDLIVIASAVAYTDRTIRRQTSRGWSRTLDVTVPVLSPSFWSRSDVDRSLRELLRLLTGDMWQFNFTRRRNTLEADPVSQLRFKHRDPAVVMPYSEGMDSFAVARLLDSEEASTRLVLVTTGDRSNADAASLKGRARTHRMRIAVPVKLRAEDGLREPSYRSRSLIYNVMAAVAAQMVGTSRLIVAESGQGTLGPWLSPMGNEAPDVRTHPLFTSALEELFGLVLEQSFAFEHRQIWNTKGQTLQALVAAGEATDWRNTHSCARSSRQMHLNGNRVHCGVCAACLLRRVSLFASGLGHNAEPYMWPNLGAPSFIGMYRANGEPTTENDVDQAFSGAIALNQLAQRGAQDLTHEAWTLARALKRPNEVAIVEARLRRLIEAHAHEWSCFLHALGSRSFLQRWVAP
jgi:7-cyano-7-deazaguanine synthase in queuosine biosynthesis